MTKDLLKFASREDSPLTKHLTLKLKKNNQLYRRFKEHSDLPKTESYVRVEVKSNDYLKLYRQKNNKYEGDNDNAKSILSNLDYESIRKVAYKYPFNRKTLIEPDY